ncbi:MAG: HTTM domain-containing protein [Weeksellaceae bacterium]|nr:HTTM domain-containing protein [Weeksellaceae bacterium]
MNYLFDKVDNSKLVIFRVFFGLLVTIECWGAIATGWVKETLVDTTYTFTFIGFEWTQFLLGDTMYAIYAIMGALGVLIMLGAFYKAAAWSFFLLWGLTYFMQKSHYNNHYYLLWVVALLMAIVPAHRYMSIDSNFNARLRSMITERWTINIFKIQIFFVYFFAAVAKLYPGWYEHRFLQIRMASSAQWFRDKMNLDWFADFITQPSIIQFLTWGGIFFDFLIVPLLLFKPTRKIAFLAAAIFHIFNSITLQIGIFPYFALALCIFFFDNDEVRNWFLPWKGRFALNDSELVKPVRRAWIQGFILIFIAIQLYLPLRHWLIPGDVLWTEEGHRKAWRMMLRSKTGMANFVVVTPDGESRYIQPGDYLRPHQIPGLYTKPDHMWQFAQKIKQDFSQKGQQEVQVYVKNSMVSINGGPMHPFINDSVDLANTKWRYFGQQSWILSEPENYYYKDQSTSQPNR